MHIDWAYIQDRFDWLGHIIEATIQALIIAVFVWLFFSTPFALAVVIGGAVAVGHFWGREKRDYEIEVHMPPPQLKSYFFWKWSWDGKTDFFPVLALYTLYIAWFAWSGQTLG